MKVLQYQDRCAIGRGERVDRPNRGQRITRPRINFGAGNLQSLLNIPGRHSPVFLVAKLRDRDERIGMLMRFNPETSETCTNIFRQPIGKCHRIILLSRVGKVESQNNDCLTLSAELVAAARLPDGIRL